MTRALPARAATVPGRPRRRYPREPPLRPTGRQVSTAPAPCASWSTARSRTRRHGCRAGLSPAGHGQRPARTQTVTTAARSGSRSAGHLRNTRLPASRRAERPGWGRVVLDMRTERQRRDEQEGHARGRGRVPRDLDHVDLHESAAGVAPPWRFHARPTTTRAHRETSLSPVESPETAPGVVVMSQVGQTRELSRPSAYARSRHPRPGRAGCLRGSTVRGTHRVPNHEATRRCRLRRRCGADLRPPRLPRRPTRRPSLIGPVTSGIPWTSGGSPLRPCRAGTWSSSP